MTGRAQAPQVVRIVCAALGDADDVIDFQVLGDQAAGSAGVGIAQQDLIPQAAPRTTAAAFALGVALVLGAGLRGLQRLGTRLEHSELLHQCRTSPKTSPLAATANRSRHFSTRSECGSGAHRTRSTTTERCHRPRRSGSAWLPDDRRDNRLSPTKLRQMPASPCDASCPWKPSQGCRQCGTS